MDGDRSSREQRPGMNLFALPRRLFVRVMLRLRPVLSEIERRLIRRGIGPSDQSVIDSSGLFDAEWYLAQNPDVAAAGINPLVHYLRHGAAEGRDAIHAVAEFPEGLSFFRIARRHR